MSQDWKFCIFLPSGDQLCSILGTERSTSSRSPTCCCSSPSLSSIIANSSLYRVLSRFLRGRCSSGCRSYHCLRHDGRIPTDCHSASSRPSPSRSPFEGGASPHGWPPLTRPHATSRSCRCSPLSWPSPSGRCCFVWVRPFEPWQDPIFVLRCKLKKKVFT